MGSSVRISFLGLVSRVVVSCGFGHPSGTVDNVQGLLAGRRGRVKNSGMLNVAVLTYRVSNLENGCTSTTRGTRDVVSRLGTRGTRGRTCRKLRRIFSFCDGLDDVPTPDVAQPSYSMSIPVRVRGMGLPADIRPGN